MAEDNKDLVREDFLNDLFTQYELRLDKYLNHLEKTNTPIDKNKFLKEYLTLIESIKPYVNIVEYNKIRKRIYEDLKHRNLIF